MGVAMKIQSLQKLLAILVVTLAIVLGLFTVGQARGTPPLGIFLRAVRHHALPSGAVRLHRDQLPIGLFSEPGGLPGA